MEALYQVTAPQIARRDALAIAGVVTPLLSMTLSHTVACDKDRAPSWPKAVNEEPTVYGIGAGLE